MTSSPADPTPSIAVGSIDASVSLEVIPATVAVVAAALALVFRTGFDASPVPIVAMLGVALAILLTPRAILRWLDGRVRVSRSLALSEPALSLATLLVVTALGWVSEWLSSPLWSLVALVGYAAMVWLVIGRIKLPARASMWHVFAAIVFGGYLLGVTWRDTDNVLLHENLILGVAPTETLFHASVIEMIRSYGVPSTGLDGAPLVPINFGSHWMFAALSALIGVDALRFLELGFAIVWVPLLLKAFLTLIVELARARDAGDPPVATPLDVVFWILLVAAFAGLLPEAALRQLGVIYQGVLVSESHSVAMTLAFFTIALVATAWRAAARDHTRLIGRSPMFVGLVLPVLIGITAVAKISVGMLLLAAAAYIAIRLRLYRRAVVVVGFVSATALIAGIVMKTASATAIDTGSLLMQDIAPGWRLLWLHTTLFWGAVYVAARCRILELYTLGDIGQAVRDGALVDVEVLLVLAIAGVLSGVVSTIAGSNAMYFVDLQRWLAFALLISLPRPNVQVVIEHTPVAMMPTGSVALLLAAAPLAIAGAMNLTIPLVQAARANLATRHLIAENTSVLEAHPRYALSQALSGLARLPHRERRSAAIFVPRTNRLYWNWAGSCITTPFIAPAVAGIAALHNLPDPSCPRPDTYGFPAYRTAAGDGGTASDNRLCADASARGFGKVAVVDDVTIRWVMCGPPE